VATVAEKSTDWHADGTFSTTDPEVSDTFTYALVSGDGSTKALFQVVAMNCGPTRFSIRISIELLDSRQHDGCGCLAFEKIFTITSTNINEAPAI